MMPASLLVGALGLSVAYFPRPARRNRPAGRRSPASFRSPWGSFCVMPYKTLTLQTATQRTLSSAAAAAAPALVLLGGLGMGLGRGRLPPPCATARALRGGDFTRFRTLLCTYGRWDPVTM